MKVEASMSQTRLLVEGCRILSQHFAAGAVDERE
jgi:hypothetical protein